MKQTSLYQTPKAKVSYIPNIWDIASMLIIFSVFSLLAYAATQMSLPYQLGQPIEISLSPVYLPIYAIKTVVRMMIALGFSLAFTFTIATLAAKNRQAEKLILPLIDILQSIPILGMLSITVVGFIQLFPNSLLGPECAAIFAIFTSQVWNMALSFYQSLRTVPKEMYDIAAVFHLSGWQKYWKIEVPHAIPSLLWNTMISMSGGWFFVVASEAISVANQNILLPGVGSYISLAIIKADLPAILYAILTMLVVILLYDQLLFRPLLTWAEKFKSGNQEERFTRGAWVYTLFAKTGWLKYFKKGLERVSDVFLNPPRLTPKPYNITFPKLNTKLNAKLNALCILGWNILLIIGTLIAAGILIQFVLETVTWNEILHVLYLGFITGLKVGILTLLASLVWIPVGVWIGLNPRMIPYCQPLIQFLAAFPINLVYPIAVTLIVYYKLNVEISTAPLMILGTQWYILFNVIAGASAIPKDLRQAAKNFGLKGFLLWKRLLLPAILPYYITGAMTAAAGCWNTSIVAEVLSWGDHKLIATGLGSYITEHTESGDFPRIVLGIGIMCFYVIIINRFLWHKLYQRASTRFVLE